MADFLMCLVVWLCASAVVATIVALVCAGIVVIKITKDLWEDRKDG